MPLGITLARGDWELRRFSAFTTLAQGQWQKGDLVGMSGPGRLPSLYTSSNFSAYIGVGMNDSLNSLPTGTCTIAIPRPGCTAYIDVLTTEGTSGTSFGQVGSIVSAGGRTSTFSMLGTGVSAFSRVVEIIGPVDSAASRVEVAFIQNTAIVYSTSSGTYT